MEPARRGRTPQFDRLRISNVQIDGVPILSGPTLYGIYAILALIYVAHAVKTIQVNVPKLKAGVPEEDRYHWGSVAALNSTYFANFGAELAVVSMLPMFFETTFKGVRGADGSFLMTATLAGLIAASFAFVNLFARPLGGLLSDTMKNRKRTMLIYMAGIAVGFLGMANIGAYGGLAADGTREIVPMFEGLWWLIAAIGITIACSMFVQGAEGATFAIIPMIKKEMTGQIAGMAGAYGNVGAVCYLVLYSIVDAKTFFYTIAAGAFLSLLYCWFALKEPTDAFSTDM
ncbi:MAG: hypothetical protein CME06_00160 [Gemmatimonadetes bacterium]|nr:hypothetical protein [Gemmatimonadota bacterium]